MTYSEGWKNFALYVCPVLIMIGVILTLLVTIQINKEVLFQTEEAEEKFKKGKKGRK